MIVFTAYIFLAVFTFLIGLVLLVIIRFFANGTKFNDSCLYIGRVKHSRLKGGAVHHIDYPIFFSYLSLREMETVGYSLWPLFALDSPFLSFCSLENKDHLKTWKTDKVKSENLLQRVKSFLSVNSKNQINTDGKIMLLTHLTYFGYCFNPVSFYYIKKSKENKQDQNEIEAIIAEVSNTPWIEQYSYILHESIEGVEIIKDINKQSNDDILTELTAKVMKKFHVSPFMEMDYQYTFHFSYPDENIATTILLTKKETNELWFSASFNLKRLEFNPINILYVLIVYPLHTRIIQLWIHIEAIKLFFKGVPMFNHPEGTDVDFGYGITGKRLGFVLWILIQPILLFGKMIGVDFFKENKKEL